MASPFSFLRQLLKCHPRDAFPVSLQKNEGEIAVYKCTFNSDPTTQSCKGNNRKNNKKEKRRGRAGGWDGMSESGERPCSAFCAGTPCLGGGWGDPRG